MTTTESSNFIQQAVNEDNANGRFGARVHTRFPPEPNGYLHIGHAKSICLNFGLADEYGGLCNLRFDDTNPSKESVEYVESQKRDVRWLGFDWQDREFYASDYFAELYEFAKRMTLEGKAYVDSLSQDEIREYRGTLTQPGKPSPDRDRPIEDNVALLERMKAGEFAEGEYVLRAKIDMASPNLNMRDPVMYRIMNAEHHRTGGDWRIYPMYDFAHGQSDSIERITHSICTMEYEDHRPLYDWFLRELDLYAPRQIEFARLNLSNTVLSKRRLLRLVEGGYVSGWTDPRMPTLAGLRRRGYTPDAIRDFCDRIGVAKNDAIIDIRLLEHSLRDHLNKTAPRAMAVLRPLKVVITNFPDGETDLLDAVNNPEDASAGTRQVPFSRDLYIERDDFMENPPRRFYRLAPGREVRLRYGYFIRCEEVIRAPDGEIAELRCTYDPATRGGSAPDGRKVRSTLHWVSAAHALDAQVRLYDNLFTRWNPDEDTHEGDWLSFLNPESLVTIPNAKLEPGLSAAPPGARYQFERLGYFCADPEDSAPGNPVFNRAVTLRDSYARQRQA